MRSHGGKPQVSRHLGESYQVTESQVTEPGRQADSPHYTPASCGGALPGRVFRVEEISAGVFEVSARGPRGRNASRRGTDLDGLL